MSVISMLDTSLNRCSLFVVFFFLLPADVTHLGTGNRKSSSAQHTHNDVTTTHTGARTAAAAPSLWQRVMTWQRRNVLMLTSSV